MSTGSLPNSTEPPISWNPAELFKLEIHGDYLRCVGLAPSTGNQCKLTINPHDRAKVKHILQELKRRDYESYLDDKLEELANVSLCKRWHRIPSHSQAARMVRIWKAEVEKFKERMARMQSVASVEYLPSPPQSRSATPVATTPTRPHNVQSSRNPELPSTNIADTSSNNGQLMTPPATPLATPEPTPRRSAASASRQQDTPPITTPAGRDRNRTSTADTSETSPTRSRRSRESPATNTSVSNSTASAADFPTVPTTEPGRDRQPLVEQALTSDSEAEPVAIAVSPTTSSRTPILSTPNTLTPPETVTLSPSETLTSADTLIPTPSRGDTTSDEASTETATAEDNSTPTASLAEPCRCADAELHTSRRHRLPESCLVCIEEMRPTEDLVWCKAQCGQNMHRECWLEWTLQAGNDNGLRCPYCRQLWDFSDCSCDNEPPLVERSDNLFDTWTDLPAAAQANLLWGPLPPRPRLPYRPSL